MPTDTYGCEIWSLTLRHEYRLKVFKNRADGNIRTCERDSNKMLEKLHNEGLLNFYSVICTKKCYLKTKI